MFDEQEHYRQHLLTLPPEEILGSAYEYTIREDIVMCMEELDLTEAQAKALLASPAPLADVYKDFEKLETSYMDVIRDTIETRANELYQALLKSEHPLQDVFRAWEHHESPHMEEVQAIIEAKANDMCHLYAQKAHQEER